VPLAYCVLDLSKRVSQLAIVAVIPHLKDTIRSEAAPITGLLGAALGGDNATDEDLFKVLPDAAYDEIFPSNWRIGEHCARTTEGS